MQAAKLLGISGDLDEFEGFIRRFPGWVEVCFRLEVMTEKEALKGGRPYLHEHRTWKSDWLFLQDAWQVFQLLPLPR